MKKLLINIFVFLFAISLYASDIEDLKKSAEQGNPDAQYNLGLLYLEGNGVEKDEKEAVKWWIKAAEQNHSGGQNALGASYRDGYGIDKDLEKALKLLSLSVEQNNPKAQYNLGACYALGMGVIKNEKEAVILFQKSADQGYDIAQYALGNCYKNGIVVEKDLEKAFEWWLKAAEQGISEAQLEVCFAYQFGEGVSKNEEEAFNWWVKVINQIGIKAIGDFSSTTKSEFEEKKKNVILKWCVKASEQNNTIAQFMTGNCYIFSIGIEEDLNKAITYFKLALNGGNLDALKTLLFLHITKRIAAKEFDTAVKELDKFKGIIDENSLLELKESIEGEHNRYELITINRLKSNFKIDKDKFNISKYCAKYYKLETIGYFGSDYRVNRSRHMLRLNNFPSASGGKGEDIELFYSKTDKVNFFTDNDFDLGLNDGIYQVKVKGYLSLYSSMDDIYIIPENIEITHLSLEEAQKNANKFLNLMNNSEDKNIHHFDDIEIPSVDELLAAFKKTTERTKLSTQKSTANISTPLANNSRTSKLGSVTVESNFSGFGEYQQRMLEAISRQWNLLKSNYTLSNIANTEVKVEFYLNEYGGFSAYKVLLSNSSNIATTLCEQAIKSTAPYGSWTQEMKNKFGNENQKVELTFYYR